MMLPHESALHRINSYQGQCQADHWQLNSSHERWQSEKNKYIKEGIILPDKLTCDLMIKSSIGNAINMLYINIY